jgi:hypothetical protein
VVRSDVLPESAIYLAGDSEGAEPALCYIETGISMEIGTFNPDVS